MAVHGFNDREQKIYYTDTDGGTYEKPYNQFLSEWDWRIGDGLASEIFHKKGIRPKTMIWVDRTPNQPRVGYFDDGGTVFYANGTSYCGFVSPKHLEFFQKVNKAPSLGRQDPGSFGKNAGICTLPSGYFDNGATVYFSVGNGTFCGFPNPPAFDSHKRSRPQQHSFGRIDIDPIRFMNYTGVCK
ncbi:hypothetical protein [Microcoleus sp. S13_B4]|uniref:hypothetical protein n=1 Tax=Microcoleus sp. S13_B4 TaxID=3055408 RepID=UPI002FD73981